MAATQLKRRSIDLGQLQDTYEDARKQYFKDKKDFEKAQLHHDTSKKKMLDAHEALKQAAKTVLE